MAVKYRRANHDGHHEPAVDRKSGDSRHWNIRRLSSRENPLVWFTLATQAATGLFLILVPGQWTLPAGGNPDLAHFYPLAVLLSLVLIAAGLSLSAMHLGKPRRFYRGFNNLRHSPMAREGACAALFVSCVGLHLVCLLPQQVWMLTLLPQLTTVQDAFLVAGRAAGILALIGRALFYVLVVPSTMPGAFFWKNKGFEEHACEIGLAANPQVGVAISGH